MQINEDIFELARENENFRKVIVTGKHSQVVLMSIKPGEEIGEEVHKVDQLLFFASGQGTAVYEGKESVIEADDMVFVHAGSRHNVINNTDRDLKIFTVYAPPQHKDGVVHKTKQEAEADSSDHYE